MVGGCLNFRVASGVGAVAAGTNGTRRENRGYGGSPQVPRVGLLGEELYRSVQRMASAVEQQEAVMKNAMRILSAVPEFPEFQFVLAAHRNLFNLHKVIAESVTTKPILEPATQQIAQQTQRIIQSILSDWESVIDTVKKYDEAAGIMVELGWPPHQDLTVGEQAMIVREYERNGAEAAARFLDHYMTTRFSRHKLRKMLKNWKRRPWLQRRQHILEQVIKGHNRQLYYLTIPVLLAQTEAIVFEAFNHRRLPDDRTGHYTYVKTYLNQVLDDDIPADMALRQFVADTVLAIFHWGEDLALEFNRHAIAHGYDLTYGTRENSLKAILLFDYIQSRFGVVSIEGEDLYHELSCRFAKRPGSRRIYQSASEAQSLGKRPCEECCPNVRRVRRGAA